MGFSVSLVEREVAAQVLKERSTVEDEHVFRDRPLADEARAGLCPAEVVEEVVDELLWSFVGGPVQVLEVGFHLGDRLDAVPDVVEVHLERCAALGMELFKDPGFGATLRSRRWTPFGGGRRCCSVFVVSCWVINVFTFHRGCSPF